MGEGEGREEDEIIPLSVSWIDFILNMKAAARSAHLTERHTPVQ